MDQMKQEAHQSFMKNNVRTEMAYITSQALWGSPITESGTSDRKETQSPRTLSPNMMMTSAQAMAIQAAIEEMRRDGTDLSNF
jgi:hypothetical protein